MKNFEGTRAMKLEWLERCARRHVVYCNSIAQFDLCEDYWEVERKDVVIVLESGEHERLKRARASCVNFNGEQHSSIF